MTTENSLIEQHVREYESRMRHIDELLEQAHKALAEGKVPEAHRAELEEVRRGRERLATLYDELRLTSTENWRRDEIILSGPMGVWDAVAQQLERLVERLER